MDRPLKVGRGDVRPQGVGHLGDHPRLLRSRACPIDVVFYSTYELQVEALLDGTIDIAWNSPLAWLDAQRRSGDTCRAIAMRDTDRDRVSYFVARRDGPVKTLADLRGRTLATGALDSPQAMLIPLGRLRRDGLDPERRPHCQGVRRARRQARRSRRRRARRFRVRASRRGGGLRDARSELGGLDEGRHDRRGSICDRRRDRPLRSLRLHGTRRTSMQPRSGTGSTRCSRCDTTIQRTGK